MTSQLMHSSKAMNRGLKTALAVSLVFLLSWAEYGVVQATVSGLDDIEQWVAMYVPKVPTLATKLAAELI